MALGLMQTQFTDGTSDPGRISAINPLVDIASASDLLVLLFNNYDADFTINSAGTGYDAVAELNGAGKLTFSATEGGIPSLLAVYSEDAADPATTHLGIEAIFTDLELGDIQMFDSGYAYNADKVLIDGSQSDDYVGLTDQKITARRATDPETETIEIQYGSGGAGSGIEVLEFRLPAGDDIVNVQSTPASTSVLLQGQGGNDVFSFGVDPANLEQAHPLGQLDSGLVNLASATGEWAGPATFRLVVGHFDAVGNVLETSDTAGYSEQVSLNGLPSGDYYVRIVGRNGDVSRDYDLSLRTPV